jgi:hypothetical protein
MDTKRVLECALAGISVLRALKATDSKLTYGQFARAIGLLGDNDPWKIQYRDQVADVLNVISAIDKMTSADLTGCETDFNVLMNARTEEPGAGINHTSRLVIEKAS